MKRHFFFFVPFVFYIFSLLSSCQTNKVVGLFDDDNHSQYLSPIHNQILLGSVTNSYKAINDGLINSRLYSQNEYAQFILSKVKILSVIGYNERFNMPAIIICKDIDDERNKEYNFFFVDAFQTEKTFIGDEIYILWTQGDVITNDGVTQRYNQSDYINTKIYDCFVENNLYRVIVGMSHSEGDFDSVNFWW